MQILIAEDNFASQTMLQTALADLGHDVKATGDGRAEAGDPGLDDARHGRRGNLP